MVGTFVADDAEVAEYMTDFLWSQIDEKGLAEMVKSVAGVSLIRENMVKEHIKIIEHLRKGGYTIQRPVREELS